LLCERRCAQVGVSFAERFADSYRSQLAAFVDGVHAWAKGEPAVPNISLERTLLLARLVDACERSVKLGQTVEIEDALASASIVLPLAPCKGENGRTSNDAVPPGSVSMPMGGAPPVPYPIDVTQTFHVTPPVNVTPAVDDKPPADATLPLDVSPPAELRTYDGTTAARVKQLYAQMRRNQCVEHVMRMRTKYVGPGALGSVRMCRRAAIQPSTALSAAGSREQRRTHARLVLAPALHSHPHCTLSSTLHSHPHSAPALYAARAQVGLEGFRPALNLCRRERS
jgi:hypothetical protein